VHEPTHILLIRPSALGDVCRTVPVLVSLHQRFPQARIDWLVQSGFEDAIASHPALHRPVLFERRRLSLRRMLSPAWWQNMRSLVHDLRSPRYDMVIDAQGLGRSGFFAWVTGARRRVGHAHAAELGWLWLNERIDVPHDLHTVDRMLALTSAIGATPRHDMRLYTCEADRAAVDHRLVGRRFAVVAPTSRWPGKRWPADRYAAVVDAMLADMELDAVAIVASPGEEDQIAPLLEACTSDPRIVDLTGRTTVGTLMATIEASAFVLANDSAALHMAVGFDRPMVGLFGPTRIDRVGPYRHDDDVIQPHEPEPGVTHKIEPEAHAMMARIEVRDVIEAVHQRLASSKAHA
jgi:heptosyltransferase-1